MRSVGKIVVLALLTTLMGCSYSSTYLKGQPMSQEQYQLIQQSLEDATVHRGMTYQEVYDILGPAQMRSMNVWTYMAGRVNYTSGSSEGDKWQFNFRRGKLYSVWFTRAGTMWFRRVLKDAPVEVKKEE